MADHDTGARRGEICGLRWSQVDLDHAMITIRRTVYLDDQAAPGRGSRLLALARGLSTRDVEDAFCDATGELLISKSTVSEITDRLWEDYQDCPQGRAVGP